MKIYSIAAMGKEHTKMYIWLVVSTIYAAMVIQRRTYIIMSSNLAFSKKF
jgi:hypothetical protein